MAAFTGLVLLLGAAGLSSLPVRERLLARRWRTYDAPTGDLRLVVYRMPQWLALPGSASDAEGFVQLEDENGKVWEKARVPSLLVISEPEWRSDAVEMKLVADWKLPVARR